LSQLGVGPEDGFYITDSEPTWDDFLAPENQLNMVKTYVFLKVRMMFDPPSTSYLIEAMNQQILEHEWRLNAFREVLLTEQGVPAEELPLLSVLDGGDP
jgi:hypothetical protein